MANSRKRPNNSSNYVDISSNTQVVNIYKKKGKAKRIVALVLAVVLLITGVLLVVGCTYTNNVLNELTDVTEATEPTVETISSLIKVSQITK